MDRYAPEQVADILRSARTDRKSREVDDILSSFRKRWLRWARHRCPRLEIYHEDAAQEASIILLDRIAQLRDRRCVRAWANQIFLSVLLEASRKQRRRARWGACLIYDPDDPEDALGQFAAAGPTPEDLAILRERLEIVRNVTRTCEVAWLRFVEQLSEDDIAERTGLSRNTVATLLKRFRRVLRRLLDGIDAQGRPLSASKILERTGLSRDLQAELSKAIERLRSSSGNGGCDENDDDVHGPPA